MNPETWVATGHVAGFSDPLIDCKDCKTRHRADKLVEEWSHSQGKDIVADGWTDEQLVDYIMIIKYLVQTVEKQTLQI